MSPILFEVLTETGTYYITAGESWARGLALSDFADLLIDHGFVNVSAAILNPSGPNWTPQASNFVDCPCNGIHHCLTRNRIGTFTTTKGRFASFIKNVDDGANVCRFCGYYTSDVLFRGNVSDVLFLGKYFY